MAKEALNCADSINSTISFIVVLSEIKCSPYAAPIQAGFQS